MSAWPMQADARMSQCLLDIVRHPSIEPTYRRFFERTSARVPPQHETSAALPIGLAPDAIVVPIEMRAVTGIAPVDGRGTGRTRFGAVGERAAAITGSGGRAPAFGQGRAARWRRRTTVTVVIPGLPVGVATAPVEATAVRDGLDWQCQCKQQ
jgi:hypothetical protein